MTHYAIVKRPKCPICGKETTTPSMLCEECGRLQKMREFCQEVNHASCILLHGGNKDWRELIVV